MNTPTIDNAAVAKSAIAGSAFTDSIPPKLNASVSISNGTSHPATQKDPLASFHSMPLVEAGFDCDDAHAQVELGMALQQADSLASAVSVFMRAIELQPMGRHARQAGHDTASDGPI